MLQVSTYFIFWVNSMSEEYVELFFMSFSEWRRQNKYPIMIVIATRVEPNSM